MSKGDLTRQRILEAAAPIFNQRGFAGCSMQDVMDATGLEKGGIYRHFRTKDELAAEALRFALSQSIRTRTDGLDHVESTISKLRFIVERFVETPSTMPGGCPLMNTAIDADDGNPELLAVAQKGMAEWKKRIVAIVVEGQRRGEIGSHVSATQVANVLVATLEGALMISRLEGSRQALLDAREVLETVVGTLAAVPVEAAERVS